MATAQQLDVACPKCGGNMWDNRLNKRNPKSPDFKCKDRSCDGVIWPPRQAQRSTPRPQQQPPAEFGEIPGVPMAASAPAVATTNAQDRLKRIFQIQELCFTHAMALASKAAASDGVDMTLEGISALTAQALIQFFGDKR